MEEKVVCRLSVGDHLEGNLEIPSRHVVGTCRRQGSGKRPIVPRMLMDSRSECSSGLLQHRL
jgi:hypothetical protein